MEGTSKVVKIGRAPIHSLPGEKAPVERPGLFLLQARVTRPGGRRRVSVLPSRWN